MVLRESRAKSPLEVGRGVFPPKYLPLSASRRWGDAKLLHQAHGIHLAPMFHKFATSNADSIDHTKGYALAGWGNTHKLAFMGATPGATEYHLVVFGDNVVNGDFKVWEGAAKDGGKGFDGLTTRRESRWEFFVLNEVGRTQLIDQAYISPSVFS